MGGEYRSGLSAFDGGAGYLDEETTCRINTPAPGPTALECRDPGSDPSLERALRLMEAEALVFATRFIKDGSVRLQYGAEIRRYASEIMAAVRRGEVSLIEAHQLAHQMRNNVLDAMRLRSSDIGRAYAESLKQGGAELADLHEKYSRQRFGKTFDRLTQAERNRVYLDIIESSGRPRQSIMRVARPLRNLGRGLAVVTFGFAIYNIAAAEDKVEATAREGALLGGGILGGAAGGATAGLVCGPGAWACSTVGVFVGGALGALGMDYLFDWVWD